MQIKAARPVMPDEGHGSEWGRIMANLLEFNARAELCRKFAKLEPHASSIWLAEAERWSRLTRELPIMSEYQFCQRGASSASREHQNEPTVRFL
jgi:hypothetical protein